MSQDAETVAARAASVLAGGSLAGPLLAGKGRVSGALPVLAPDGGLRGWVAPVVAGDLIAGFFRTDPRLGDWRFTSFQRRPDTLDGCPPASLWLDTDGIARRAAALARPGEAAAPPVLSFDGVPDRLAWAVDLTAPDGTTRRILVAGRAVWEADAGR